MTDTTSPQDQPAASAWRQYPFDLVPEDDAFRFPAAEGAHDWCQSDTWFIAGDLIAESGRRFAFLTIYNRNRPGGAIVADFHTTAVFDLDHGSYGTYTDYDMPPKSMAPGSVPKMQAADGHLDLTFVGRAGESTWRTRRDARAELVPYSYELSLTGVDHTGVSFELRLDATAAKPPVPVGASKYGGRFPCLGQAETFSYFQTGVAMTGSLRWGEIDEVVSGFSGHIDRQWFPLPAGGGGTGGDQRAISHEWRTIHLDNGVELVGWRQFDRLSGNATLDFTGATVTFPNQAPQCVQDIDVETTSYVRWPEPVRQLMRPPVAGRYMPDRHSLSSATLDLHLVGESLVAAPAHALPIEYMEGPFLVRGTMGGQPVTGFGIWERSLALYRDTELIEVLRVTARSATASEDVTDLIETLGGLIAEGRRDEAGRRVAESLRPALSSIGDEETAVLLGQLVDDLEQSLSVDAV